MSFGPQSAAGRVPLPLPGGFRGTPLGLDGVGDSSGLTNPIAYGQLPAAIAVDGVGYAVGYGGAVAQLTDKTTTVIINEFCGTITTDAASLLADAIVSFTVTNSNVAANDLIVTTHNSGGTVGGYLVIANTPAAGSFKITIRNVTAGPLAEALVIRFAVIKGAVT